MALRQEGFWDRHYEDELRNFDDAGDEGEVWFGKGLSRKVSARIVDLIKEDTSLPDDISVLDIGCGNAFLLIDLAQRLRPELHQKRASFLGLDYSSNSIELCKRIIDARGLTEEILSCQCDFLDLDQLNEITRSQTFDFVIDVGTYDAILLLGGEDQGKLSSTKKSYMTSLYSVVRSGSIYVLASCNHTQDELMELFHISCPKKRGNKLIGCIDTPKFQFGGKTGSKVCCLIFKFD